MNTIFLIGRMTSDVEIRCNEAGTSKGQFCLAVPRRGAKEGTQQTDFINIVVWNKVAENLAKYMGKGSQLGIEGTLRADNYKDREGKSRTYTYVLAESIQYLSESKKGEQKEETKKEETTESDFDETFKLNDLELSDDDLPF